MGGLKSSKSSKIPGISRIIITTVILSAFVLGSYGISMEDELNFTPEEKIGLEKFTADVIGYLPRDYMKTQIYLIRWLRAAYVDVPMAKKMLKSHLKWRADNKIDTILEEDFSYFEKEYIVNMDALDIAGRPVVVTDIGDWDIRKATMTGRLKLLLRYVTYGIEKSYVKVRALQAQGKNVTQVQIINNLKGFNLIQHGCIQCLPFYVDMVNILGPQYPYLTNSVVYINAPSLFSIMWDMMSPYFTPHLLQVTKLYGTSKMEVQKVLHSMFSPEQLEIAFGVSNL